jgi:hypothetical protein
MDEFKKCPKELVPVNDKDRIGSFVVSVQVNGSFLGFQVTGGKFTEQLSDVINRGASGQKVLIEKVKMLHDNKTVNVPGVVIKLE